MSSSDMKSLSDHMIDDFDSAENPKSTVKDKLGFLVSNADKGITGALGSIVDNPINLAKSTYGAGRIYAAEKGWTNETPAQASEKSPEITYPVSDFLLNIGKTPEQIKYTEASSKPDSKIGEYAERGIQFAAAAPLGGWKNLGSNAIKSGTAGLTAQAAHDVFPESNIAPVIGALLPSGASYAGSKIPRNKVDSGTLDAAKTGRDLGYVVPPSQAEGGAGSKLLEGYAGKISTSQGASIKNQEVTNRLAAESLGLPEGTKVTHDVLDSIRENAGKVYEQAKQLGTFTTDSVFNKELGSVTKDSSALRKEFPDLLNKDIAPLAKQFIGKETISAEATVEAIKELRDQAKDNFKSGNSSYARAQIGISKALEGLMERNIEGSAGPEFLKQFKDARQTIAKTYTVEEALNDATGNVSAGKLAKDLTKGKPLSGGLKDAAKFSQAFPKATQIINSGSPGISPLDFATGGIMSAAQSEPSMMATMMGRPMARSLILSKPYQSMLLKQKNKKGMRAMPELSLLGEQTFDSSE